MIELRLGRARAIWTDRLGGVSAAPYDDANLSLRVGDDDAAVGENRARLAAHLELVPPEQWWWLDQVHGSTTIVATAPAPSSPPVADATITATPGLPLTVMTADCAPIALATNDAVGVVHAGWQGIVAGVIDAGVSALRDVSHGEIKAAIGPCIRPARYEFGRAELDRVVDVLGSDVEGRTDNGDPALDLPRAARLALERAGVVDVDDVEICTAASPDYFSHRRDGTTGRQALVLVLES